MPCRRLTYATPADWTPIRDWLAPRANPDLTVEDRVKDILADVKTRGDEALVDYTRSFDCTTFSTDILRVNEAEFSAAREQVSPEDMAIIAEAAENIRVFHEEQRQRSWWTTREDGSVLGQLVTPVDRVGLYVPGGQGGETPLISSLLMNAIPALVAGVTEIAAVSPPRADGSMNPAILAAAELLGITEIYKVGSAWSIAALAFGTSSIPAVSVIAGPGNIYVTTAKRLVLGQVGIDMIAGPSEIAILADGSVAPAWLAADMLSQAEHDPLASAVVITTESREAEAVCQALETQLAALPRAEIARMALADWSAIVTVPDLDAGLELVNRLAPEHLELALADPWQALGKVRNAGAIFMGASAPEPVGDYFAGPNHVLPTLGNARFSSALSVDNFIKKSSVIATSAGFVAAHGEKVARLARMEGLEAHARSVETRLGKKSWES